MRAVVFGLGAVGGATAAALSRNGTEVLGVARGAQLDAVRARGLHLRAPDLEFTARFDCVGSVAEAGLGADDVVLLCVKSQDTGAALDALRAAGLRDQPVFCLQNGVANERAALRHFPNVHGVTVMLPASYLDPGEIAVHATPKFGLFDIGRYPEGLDADDARLCAAFEGSLIQAFPQARVMESKHGKLLVNLKNVAEAAAGYGTPLEAVMAPLRAEALAVFAAHGIAHLDVGKGDARRAQYMRPAPIAGVARAGSSTAQSLLRGQDRVESDFLNGEIVLLGRLAGIATPANAYMVALAQRLAQKRVAPGSLSPEAILQEMSGA